MVKVLAVWQVLVLGSFPVCKSELKKNNNNKITTRPLGSK